MNWHDPVQWYAPPDRSFSVRELLADRVIHSSGLVITLVGGVVLVVHGLSLGTPQSRLITITLGIVCFAVEIILSQKHHLGAWDWTLAVQSIQLDRIGIDCLCIGLIPSLWCSYEEIEPQDIPWVVVSFGGFIGLLIDDILILSRDCRKTPEERAVTDVSVWTIRDMIHACVYVICGWCNLPCVPKALEKHDLPLVIMALMMGTSFTGGLYFYIDGDEFNKCIWHLFSLVTTPFFIAGIWESMNVMAWRDEQKHVIANSGVGTPGPVLAKLYSEDVSSLSAKFSMPADAAAAAGMCVAGVAATLAVVRCRHGALAISHHHEGE